MKQEVYCVYHIPGIKIGVTNNLEDRVENQQGYSEDEYDIMAMSMDIDWISEMELKLQEEYGYKVDRQPYKEIIKLNKNAMNINVTSQTTTFPVPLSGLKAYLTSWEGQKWDTDNGPCRVTPHSITWLVRNARVSMYNTDRCYVYNKAFAKYYEADPFRNTWFKEPTFTQPVNDYKVKREEECGSEKCCPDTGSTFDSIRDWARDRGIYDSGDCKTQYTKLMEEAGELARAVLKEDKPEFIDAIGDMVVVLTNLAELGGVKIEDCIDSAYNVISKRKGVMFNGTFRKEQL